jgi:phosphoesterase RecJ-like protein
MSNQANGPLIQLEWDEANALIHQAQTIITLSHVFPDGDAVGSLMGLTLALREQGKTVYPAIDGGCPDGLKFIPYAAEILDDLRPVLAAAQPDLVISVDASDKTRLGEVGAQALALNVPYIQQDHHQTNLIFGDVNLVDARTVAAAEGIFDWLQMLGWPISQQVAQCLLTGIVTDTLCFRTANVTASIFGKVQTLLELGAELPLIVQYTMARQPISLHRLYGQVLSRMKLEDGVIWLSLRPEDFEAAGFSPDDHTGLSSYLVQADEAYIGATFQDVGNGEISCSFRSVPGFDVSGVALSLGGGGHVQASGCTIRGKTLAEVEAMVIPLLKEQVRLGQPIYV